MPIIRKELKPSEVYPDGIRYNPSGDQVEVLIDGVWKPSPESDPRKVNTLPPRITADTKCDAAASVADALENQISQILTAIDNGSTVFTIVGIILSIFTLGVFAIFVSIALAIADFMLGLGSAAIEAALPPSAFDTLKCILYCYMDDNGRIAEADLPNIKQDVVDQIGAAGGTILNSMLDLAGVGGINGLASVGTSTGDCSTCDCPDDWCYIFDFTFVDGDWTVVTSGGYLNGSWSGAGGWVATDHLNTVANPDVADRLVYIKRAMSPRTVTRVLVTYNYVGGTYDSTALRALFIGLNGVDRGNIIRSAMVNGNSQTFEITGSWDATEDIEIFLRSSRDISSPYTYSGSGAVLSVRMEGVGTNPFGADNCP